MFAPTTRSIWTIGALSSAMLLAAFWAADATSQQPLNPPTPPPPNAAAPTVTAPNVAAPSVTVRMPITPEGPLMRTVDQQVAEWLAIDNRGEVALAKLALSKTENTDIHQFAERMVHDHSQMLQNLQPFETMTIATPTPNPNAGIPLLLSNGDISPTPNPAKAPGPAPAGHEAIAGTPTAPAAPGTAGTPAGAPLGSTPTPGSVPNSSTVPTPGGLTPPTTIPTILRPTVAAAPLATAQSPGQAPQVNAQYIPANANPGGLDFLEVMRQIGHQSLTDSARIWDTKKPVVADMAYMGQQIAAHEMFIETSKVLRPYASPQLQTLIDGGIQTARSHLAEAVRVMHAMAPDLPAPETAASAK